ncbi:MAG: hypothetical protein ABSE89_02295 [Sedimentisphaerales bacterium]
MTEQQEQGSGKGGRGEHPAKKKAKNNLKYYAKQLITLSALLQAVAKNLQKEIEELKS